MTPWSGRWSTPSGTSTCSSRWPSSSSARWRPNPSGRSSSSVAARTPPSCSTWRPRRSGPARIPFPVMHVDTGHNFAEVISLPRRPGRGRGARLLVASVQDSIDQGRVADPGPGAFAQPPPDDDPARCHQRQRLRRRLRRRPARRGQGPGQGARALLPRLLRAVGPQAPATRAVAALPGHRASGRAPARLPALGLDRARHLAVHPARADRAAVHLLRARTRGRRARRHAARPERVGDARRDARRSARRPCASGPSATRRAPAPCAPRPTPSRRSSARSSASRISERGATRADDRFSETAMEDRKREGYF